MLLENIVNNDKPFDLDTLKLSGEFSEAQPIRPAFIQNPVEPKLIQNPVEPNRSDSGFGIKYGLLDHIFRWRMKRKQRTAEDRFVKAHTDWTIECEKNNKWSVERINAYNLDLHDINNWNDQIIATYNSDLHDWTTRKINYDDEVYKTNEAVDDLRERYL